MDLISTSSPSPVGGGDSLGFRRGGVGLLILKYYPAPDRLREILVTHSTLVTRRALKICDAHPELHIDRQFVEEAAMLHDIGICRCHAPGICCFGTEPYIRHGLIGGQMLRSEGYPRHARVCERHTGAGLTAKEIVEQDLPLPHQDFLPETMEEKVICYADKFYSKTHPEREKTLEQAKKSIAKFGNDGLQRFLAWQALFESDAQ